jgi:ATPase subunit of ABC transporter with duplicated ATPase domains
VVVGDRPEHEWAGDARVRDVMDGLLGGVAAAGYRDGLATVVSTMSGGEKARLVLATMLYDPPNFLVLDEPTNHLDVGTKEMLVRALAGFEGTMLFVSHDRRFLGALSNRVLELTPDGIVPYGGGYTEYVARTGREAPGLRHVDAR